MTVSARPLTRRGALGLLALPATTLLVAPMLAGCVDEPPPPPAVFAPLDFSFLPKLRLNVSDVEVVNAWAPAGVAGGLHVEPLSPVQPVDALRQMARERLIPAGASGHATFSIDDASLVQRDRQFIGTMVVHLDVTTSDGANSGYAKAAVTATRTITDNDPQSAHAALYALVKTMMANMNVELEYQVRRSLRDYLQSASEPAPAPAPVETQDLAPPPAKP